MDLAGFDVPIEGFSMNLSSLISGTWIWIALVFIMGLLLIAVVGVLLFFKTWNRKIVFFEDISGTGHYQRTSTTRARVLKLNKVGDELLKTLAGNHYISAYGKKMGRRTYWLAVGPDGFFYNFVLGDLDTKKGILDIEPVDRDVRMFHVAMDRMAFENYGQKSKAPAILLGIGIFLALAILMVGMYVVAGRFVDASNSLSVTADANKEVLNALTSILDRTDTIQVGGNSGLVPAS